MKKYKKDQIVYIQGTFKARVEEDDGGNIKCEPLEGYSKKGEIHSYARYLIKPEKSVNQSVQKPFAPKSIWLDQLDAEFIRPDIELKITSGDLLQLNNLIGQYLESEWGKQARISVDRKFKFFIKSKV